MTPRFPMFGVPTRFGLARAWIAPAVAALLSACGGAPEYEDQTSKSASTPAYASATQSASVDEGEDREPFDEDAAREAAEDNISDDTYGGIGMPYGCTDDCSGHEAGFRYRAEHGYTGHNADSPSFNEGGQAFEEAVEERVEEMRGDYESGGEPPY